MRIRTTKIEAWGKNVVDDISMNVSLASRIAHWYPPQLPFRIKLHHNFEYREVVGFQSMLGIQCWSINFEAVGRYDRMNLSLYLAIASWLFLDLIYWSLRRSWWAWYLPFRWWSESTSIVYERKGDCKSVTVRKYLLGDKTDIPTSNLQTCCTSLDFIPFCNTTYNSTRLLAIPKAIE